MKQLLKKKHSTRIIVFALLLTMLAWLAPVNVGVAKAADMTKDSTLKVGKPLYQKCAGKAYFTKYKDGAEFICIKFMKASKGKIKFRIANGYTATGYQIRSNTITGTVKGKKIKFKMKKWYSQDESGSTYSWKDNISGTITIVNSNTIKIKVSSRSNPDSDFKKLNRGKSSTLKYVKKNSSHYWEPWR